MALRRCLWKRMFSATTPPPPPIRSPPPRHQRRALNNHCFLSLPVGDKLREQLKPIDVTAADAKRLMRLVKLETVRERLRNIPAATLPHAEFLRICADACGSAQMGADLAKALDDSGNVIVLSAVVFLRPDQVAKSMEAVISQSIAMPNDPRRTELENLEQQKSVINEKARSVVRAELYCGLGFLGLQTLGLMRLTFWELSWDVMEPICFFLTSLHFGLAYAFFLRTSKEPSFQGYFHTRFKAKQEKLMKLHSFDVERYNHLCKAFYPNRCNDIVAHDGNGPCFRGRC